MESPYKASVHTQRLHKYCTKYQHICHEVFSIVENPVQSITKELYHDPFWKWSIRMHIQAVRSYNKLEFQRVNAFAAFVQRALKSIVGWPQKPYNSSIYKPNRICKGIMAKSAIGRLQKQDHHRRNLFPKSVYPCTRV